MTPLSESPIYPEPRYIAVGGTQAKVHTAGVDTAAIVKRATPMVG